MPCGVSSMRRQWRDIIAIGKLLNCMVARASSPSTVPRWLPPPVTMARVARSGFSTAVDFVLVRQHAQQLGGDCLRLKGARVA